MGQFSNLLADIYQVSIELKDADITKAIRVNSCNIYESISQLIPTCEIDLTLPIDLINFKPEIFSDGTPITISLKTRDDFKGFQINETYNFRLYKIAELEVDSVFLHCIVYGIFDCYKLFEDGNQYNANANTSEIVCKIAGVCGLQCEKDGTSDKQLWIAGEKNARDFIKYMAKYGYINDTSGIFWCVTRNKKLIYKNIITAFNNCSNGSCKTLLPAAGFDKNNKVITCTNLITTVNNGENNIKHSGYGGKDSYFVLKDYKLKKAYCNKTSACSSCCNVNSELSKGLSTVWPGFDVGNVHEKYYQAPRQNDRILAMFSTEFEAYCQFMQPCELTNVLDIKYAYSYAKSSDSNINILNPFSTKAMVHSHRIEISPMGVSSYIGLVMQGLNINAEKSGSY